MNLDRDIYTKKKIRNEMNLTENQLNYLLRKSGIEGMLIGNTKVYSFTDFLNLIETRRNIR